MSERPRVPRPQVIAHRGASAYLPEHTLAAYARAIADGADLIEPDLVMTRDGVLVARHENEIGETTDVAAHPRFASRRTRKQIDGVTVEGWFTEDFTLAELKTLRTRERLPELRGTAHDGQHPIATLEEIIELLATGNAHQGRMVGLIPEIKHGTWFQRQGLPMERRLLDTLAAHACTRRVPVVIQSFELANLRALRACLGDRPNVRLLQLVDEPQARPWDVAVAGGSLRYADLLTPAGLRQVATWADAIGPNARAILPLDAEGRLGPPTPLVREAHAAGLQVHAWTFRPENVFLPRALWRGDDPATRHPEGSVAEIRAHLDAGIDAFFTDDPAMGRAAVGE
ncbi:glycerophosphodiester phosphodiesterase [Frateuria sp. GZRR33]|uniref:glycerophosphodiester phosphodiesterase n=1 Tax=Frateuria sp. GZRR33 TaxID=3351535 RepID=UPI003EDC6739